MLTSTLRYLTCIALAIAAAACGGSPSSPSQNANVPFSSTDLRAGTGTTAANGNTLTVSYTGWLYDPGPSEHKGSQFDSGTYTLKLGAGQVIPGWDRGLVGMKVGGLRRLIIPPDLAYGSSGNGPIPGNATLVFDIELLNVS